MRPILIALLAAFSIAAQAQAPQNPAPAGHGAAAAPAGHGGGHSAVDCSKAVNPAECEAVRKAIQAKRDEARKACQGKKGDEEAACIKAQMMGDSKPAAAHAH